MKKPKPQLGNKAEATMRLGLCEAEARLTGPCRGLDEAEFVRGVVLGALPARGRALALRVGLMGLAGEWHGQFAINCSIEPISSCSCLSTPRRLAMLEMLYITVAWLRLRQLAMAVRGMSVYFLAKKATI